MSYIKAKMLKFSFSWGFAPHSLQCPRPLSWISGNLLQREGRGRRKGKGEGSRPILAAHF